MKKTILILLAAFASTVAAGAEVSKDEFGYATFNSFMRVSAEQKIGEAQRPFEKISQKMCGLEFSELSTGLIYGKSINSKKPEQLLAEINEISKSDLSEKCQDLIGNKFTKVIANVKTLVAAPDNLKLETTKFKQGIELAEKSSTSKKKASMGVIGLVPDVSREADVSARANTDDAFCDPFCLKIGGHNLQCSADYHGNGTLSLLTCWFGGDAGKSDNIAIFTTLEQGFSEKFGKPKIRLKRQVQNSFGAKFEVINPKWIDDSGNILEMASRANRVDTGAFALKSAILRAQEAVEAKKNEADRKF